MANVISKIIKNWTEYQIYGSGGAAWAWDVTWPSSATNWHLAVFSWTTGKVIKDWWAVPTVPTKVSQLQNDAWYTTNTGTITGINMNWASKWTSWVVDLGTVITAHQNIKTVNNNTMTGTWNVSVGTITWITMNGASKGTSWVVNLGTVITSHQSIKTINWNTMTWTGNISVWTLTSETVSSWDSWTNYVIKTSTTAPAAWTASNIITFVIDS